MLHRPRRVTNTRAPAIELRHKTPGRYNTARCHQERDRWDDAWDSSGLTALALLLLAGCATPWAVDSFEAPEGKLTARQTWFWKGGEFGTPASIDPQVVAHATAQMRLS